MKLNPKSESRKPKQIRMPKSERTEPIADQVFSRWVGRAFPLTPALSRREREDRVQRQSQADAPTSGKGSSFGLRVSGFGFASDFGLRISGFAPIPT